MAGLSSDPHASLNGHSLLSFCTVSSENFLPISRFASNTVFFGFLAAWFLAASPTSLSFLPKATYDGVVFTPYSLAIISTFSFIHTATQEYVVPRSIPTADIYEADCCCPSSISLYTIF